MPIAAAVSTRAKTKMCKPAHQTICSRKVIGGVVGGGGSKETENKSKKSWTVPNIMKGGVVEVGGPERPRMHQPSTLNKKCKNK